MNKNEIYEALTKIFREVFMDDTIEITETTNANDIEEWDSLMQMALLTEVEKEFNMKFKPLETVTIENVGEMVDIIVSRTGGSV